MREDACSAPGTAGRWRGKDAADGHIRVILVEDHALMRDAVKLVFREAEGIELVGEVANGHDLPLMKRVSADFVLLM